MKKHGKKRTWLTPLLILALLAALLAFAVWDSAEHLQLTEYTVSSDRCPDGFDGFKIIQLSDLHGADFGDRLVEQVLRQEPDIIALTGDFVTDSGDLEAVRALVPELVKICDVYFVSGNHEFGSRLADEVRGIMEDAGVKYLGNDAVVLERNGDSIVLAGVEDPLAYADMPSPPELMAELDDKYPDSYKILLGHRNYWMEEYPELPVDLILSGHAHGGLVRLPGVGGLIGTDRTLFPDYDAGLYENGRYTMIVSRGLGNSVPISRLFNRPEIVSIILKA